MTHPVDQLLERVREWRAGVPFGRWFEVFCRPSATGATWAVSAWQISGPVGEVRAIIHHDAQLERALERTIDDINNGVSVAVPAERSPWGRAGNPAAGLLGGPLHPLLGPGGDSPRG